MVRGLILVEVFKRDPRNGYAKGFQSFLESVGSGDEFLERIKPESIKNGAAMRAVPLGYLPNIDEVIIYSQTQARITHNTPEGTESAIATSIMAHRAINRIGGKNEMRKYLLETRGYGWLNQWGGKVRCRGYDVVCATLYLLEKHDSLSDILLKSVELGGDTDTVASISLGVGSCSEEIKQDLPKNLIEKLEEGKYGRKYLGDLDERLKEKYLK